MTLLLQIVPVLTCFDSSEDDLHGVVCGVPSLSRFSRIVTVLAEVKVVADETLVAFTSESTFTTSITTHTYTKIHNTHVSLRYMKLNPPTNPHKMLKDHMSQSKYSIVCFTMDKFCMFFFLHNGQSHSTRERGERE